MVLHRIMDDCCLGESHQDLANGLCTSLGWMSRGHSIPDRCSWSTAKSAEVAERTRQDSALSMCSLMRSDSHRMHG